MTDNKDGVSPAALTMAGLAAPASTPNPSMQNPGTSDDAPRPVSGIVEGPIGRTIKGRYTIKRLLGEGGMGGVYEGEHLEIGKRVAIKLVHSTHARDGHIAARIKQEARSTSAIESEHIVQVFDAGEDEELGLFLVMELLKGEDLSNILARTKRLGPLAACALIVQAAQGLSRAHAAGIVHRDLKPANIFVCTRDDGSSLVKLVDFGIAKLLRDAQGQASAGLTRMGMVIGTPQYMSPEQAQGLTTVDRRTDIYSLGAVLFEAIVGSSPFPEMPTYEQTILQIMTRPAPRLLDLMPDLPPGLDQLIAEMMSHDPEQRPQDMSTVRERLIAIYPAIENSRMPMRSLTDEIGANVTAFAAADTGVQRQIARAVGNLESSPRIAVRPATHSAVAVDSSSDEGSIAPAGLPRKRRAGPTIAAMAILATVAVIGGVALMRARGPSEETASGSHGLVQSTPEALPAAAAPVPAPIVPIAPIAKTEPTPSAKPAARAQTPVAAAPNPIPGRPSPRTPAPAAPPGPVAASAHAPDPTPAARPAGGTNISTEF